MNISPALLLTSNEKKEKRIRGLAWIRGSTQTHPARTCVYWTEMLCYRCFILDRVATETRCLLYLALSIVTKFSFLVAYTIPFNPTKFSSSPDSFTTPVNQLSLLEACTFPCNLGLLGACSNPCNPTKSSRSFHYPCNRTKTFESCTIPCNPSKTFGSLHYPKLPN